MDFPTLLKLTAAKAGRERWIQLATSLKHTANRAATGEPDAARQSERLLDEAWQELQQAFRAIRHPLPSRAELKELLTQADLPGT